MSAWTTEQKQTVIKMYKDAEPTAETSIEIIKDIAEELDLSPNGIRQVLIQAQEYIKKDSSGSSGGKTTTKESGTKRVSKESQIDSLKAEIERLEQAVDDDILSRLTGKAAAYFTNILKNV